MTFARSKYVLWSIVFAPVSDIRILLHTWLLLMKWRNMLLWHYSIWLVVLFLFLFNFSSPEQNLYTELSSCDCLVSVDSSYMWGLSMAMLATLSLYNMFVEPSLIGFLLSLAHLSQSERFLSQLSSCDCLLYVDSCIMWGLSMAMLATFLYTTCLLYHYW
jgi:hypothetical protein